MAKFLFIWFEIVTVVVYNIVGLIDIGESLQT